MQALGGQERGIPPPRDLGLAYLLPQGRTSHRAAPGSRLSRFLGLLLLRKPERRDMSEPEA